MYANITNTSNENTPSSIAPVLRRQKQQRDLRHALGHESRGHRQRRFEPHYECAQERPREFARKRHQRQRQNRLRGQFEKLKAQLQAC